MPGEGSDYFEWLRNRYGNTVVDLLLARIQEYAKDGKFCYDDNYRFAETTDAEALARYEKARDHGCCGYVDDYTTIMTTTSSETGKTPRWRQFRIGFNYGH